jgi:uncharacterized membrane-anchored protein
MLVLGQCIFIAVIALLTGIAGYYFFKEPMIFSQAILLLGISGGVLVLCLTGPDVVMNAYKAVRARDWFHPATNRLGMMIILATLVVSIFCLALIAVIL